MLETNLAVGDAQRARTGGVLHLGVLLDQPEHALHVSERLLDLAVDHAEKVERNVELDHEGVHQDKVAYRHRMVDDAKHGAPHDQSHSNGDDRALADVEQRERGVALDRGGLPALHALVVAQRLVFLVVEILDGLVVEKTVHRARVRPGVELVHRAPEPGSPLGDRDRERDVEQQRADGYADEPGIVAGDQDSRDEPDLEQRRQDREQGKANERRDAARAALDVTGKAARLSREMKAQRQSVQVAEYLKRDGAHGALRHLGEKEFAQLGEHGRGQAHRAVGGEQRQRQNQLRRSRQAVDDLLQHQRHAHVGELGCDQAREREEHAALVRQKVR